MGAGDLLLALGLEEKQEELIEFVPDRAHNDACYPITNAKLLSLGWRQQHSWEFGLANTVAWFSESLQSDSPDIAKVLEAHPQHNATDAAASGRQPAAAPGPLSRL